MCVCMHVSVYAVNVHLCVCRFFYMILNVLVRVNVCMCVNVCMHVTVCVGAISQSGVSGMTH